MDIPEDTLLCRLCGAYLRKGEFKHIFDEPMDLHEKIMNTLPINISPDDGVSTYICLTCYDKVILHYKFIRDVLEHEKKVNKMKLLHDSCKSQKVEIIDNFLSVHSDTIYTCPNCNVDLMILLSNNPQGCDYSFQISLAIVSHTEKSHPEEEIDTQISKSPKHLNMTKNDNTLIKDKLNMVDQFVMDDIENISSKLAENLHSPEKDKYFHNGSHTISDKENFTNQVQKNIKRKVKQDNALDTSSNPNKTSKLELTSCEINSKSVNYTYDCMDTLIKVEPVNENVSWFNRKNDCKIKNEVNVEEIQVNTFEHHIKLEESNMKAYPQIKCDLCGAKYLSKLKYDFHIERHKTNKMHKYICTVCDKEASSENLLWDHYYYTHKNPQRFICMECGKMFTKCPKLNNHQKKYNHSGMKEITIKIDNNDPNIDSNVMQKVITTDIYEKVSVNCNLCGKLISDLDPDAINDLVTCASCEDSTLSLMIDGDEAKVISPRQYHCSMCSKHFVRRERLEFHEMRHNENMNEFICSTCGKDFSAENSLYEHYLFVHKGARPHICELCGKSFQLKARLKEHHRTHTGERPYQCDICGQRCITTNALRLHRKTHFSHTRYTCNICNKSFSKKQNMNEHLEKHWKHDKTISLPQMFTCPICLEDFPTYRMLKCHMMEIHKISHQDPMLTKQKPWYECTECHEKFKHQMSLKAHRERIHEGKVTPLYQCDVCKASYRIKQLLINHIKSKHVGEKRYKCAQCEKGFNDTKSLYNHILLHTGKKPFTCEYCNMNFRRKDSRDHHRRKHTGEQPYQCPECGKSFSTYNSRTKHRKKEHGEGESECLECGERCSNQQDIRFHLNKHLGEKLKKLQNL